MKRFFQVFAILALFAGVTMFIVGTNSSHLSELRDFFWLPLILSVVLFAASSKA